MGRLELELVNEMPPSPPKFSIRRRMCPLILPTPPWPLGITPNGRIHEAAKLFLQDQTNTKLARDNLRAFYVVVWCCQHVTNLKFDHYPSRTPTSGKPGSWSDADRTNSPTATLYEGGTWESSLRNPSRHG